MSPPPAIENAFEFAIEFDNALVPFANASNSNTPTGPFHTIVPAFCNNSSNAAADSSPISKIISSSATSLIFLCTAGVVSLNSLPTTTSTGNGTLPPLASIFSIMRRASSSKSCSAKDLPTLKPLAAKKVLAIPPPTIKPSTLSANVSKTVSLVETLLPPTIAIIGRLGFSNACAKASNSSANNKPAHATGANFATACVEACAR